MEVSKYVHHNYNFGNRNTAIPPFFVGAQLSPLHENPLSLPVSPTLDFPDESIVNASPSSDNALNTTDLSSSSTASRPMPNPLGRESLNSNEAEHGVLQVLQTEKQKPTRSVESTLTEEDNTLTNKSLTEDGMNRKSGIILTQNLTNETNSVSEKFSATQLGRKSLPGRSFTIMKSSIFKKQPRTHDQGCKEKLEELGNAACKIRRVGLYTKHKKHKLKLFILWEHTETPYDKSRLEYYDIPYYVKKHIQSTLSKMGKDTLKDRHESIPDMLKELISFNFKDEAGNVLDRVSRDIDTPKSSPNKGISPFKLRKPRRIIYLKDCFNIGLSIATSRRTAIQELIKRPPASQLDGDVGENNYGSPFGIRDILLNAASSLTSEQLGINTKKATTGNNAKMSPSSNLSWSISTYSQDPYNCLTFELPSLSDMECWLQDLYILHQLTRQKALTFPLGPAYEWVWNVNLRARGFNNEYRLIGSYYLGLNSTDNLLTLFKFHQYYDEDSELERDELENYFYAQQIPPVPPGTMEFNFFGSASVAPSQCTAQSMTESTKTPQKYNILSRQDVQIAYIELCSVKKCGYSKDYFYIELGRTSSLGSGELWLRTEHELDSILMHHFLLKRMKVKKVDHMPNESSESLNQSGHLNTIDSQQTSSPSAMSRNNKINNKSSPPKTKRNVIATRKSSYGKGSSASKNARNIFRNLLTPVPNLSLKATNDDLVQDSRDGKSNENSASSSSGTLTYLPFFSSAASLRTRKASSPINDTNLTAVSKLNLNDDLTAETRDLGIDSTNEWGDRMSELVSPPPFTEDINNYLQMMSYNRNPNTNNKYNNIGFNNNHQHVDILDNKLTISPLSINDSPPNYYWSSCNTSIDDRSRLSSNASSILSTTSSSHSTDPTNHLHFKTSPLLPSDRQINNQRYINNTSPSQPNSPSSLLKPFQSSHGHQLDSTCSPLDFRERASTHEFGRRVEILKSHCNNNISMRKDVTTYTSSQASSLLQPCYQRGMFSSQDSGYIDMAPSHKLIPLSKLEYTSPASSSFTPSIDSSTKASHPTGPSITSSDERHSNNIHDDDDEEEDDHHSIPRDKSIMMVDSNDGHMIIDSDKYIVKEAESNSNVGITSRPSSFSAFTTMSRRTASSIHNAAIPEESYGIGFNEPQNSNINFIDSLTQSDTCNALNINASSLSFDAIQKLRSRIDERRRTPKHNKYVVRTDTRAPKSPSSKSEKPKLPVKPPNLLPGSHISLNPKISRDFDLNVGGIPNNLTNANNLDCKNLSFNSINSLSSSLASPFSIISSSMEEDASSYSGSPNLLNSQSLLVTGHGIIDQHKHKPHRISWGPESVINQQDPVIDCNETANGLCSTSKIDGVQILDKAKTRAKLHTNNNLFNFNTHKPSTLNEDERIRAYSLGCKPFPFRFLKKIAHKNKFLGSKSSTQSSLKSVSMSPQSPITPFGSRTSDRTAFNRTPLIESLAKHHTNQHP